jgi:hypothetical protein
MKLELIRTWEMAESDISGIQGSIVLEDNTLLAQGFLYALNVDYIKKISSDYINSQRDVISVFNLGCGFGGLGGIDTLYFYRDIHSSPEIIKIKNKHFFSQIVPDSAEVRLATSVSDSNLYPVRFEYDLYEGVARYYGMLRFDAAKKSAEWVNFCNIKKASIYTGFSYAPPMIDSFKIAHGEIYAFLSGESASINKWGMDYYELVKLSEKGEILETLIDSGYIKGEKKRGIHGSFTYTDYVILTPVFASDEWGGKQKLFSLKNQTYIDVMLPRGMSKYKIIQIRGTFFWLTYCDRSVKKIALCKADT